MGSGRMADFGAPVGEVLVAAIVAMSLGGLAGGLLETLVQRRQGTGAAPVGEDEDTPAESPAEASEETPEDTRDDTPDLDHDDVEDTIEVPLLPKDPNV